MYRKIIISTIMFLNICFLAIGQNSSYNLNSIPIAGTNNSGFGFQSLLSNTTGDNNSAIGYQSLRSNIDGIGNTAVGSTALYSNTSGTGNSAFGY